MPLWLVIMVLGAAGSGWLLLKARHMEGPAIVKKVEEGSKDVRAAAKKATRTKGQAVEEAPETSRETLHFSRDSASRLVKDIEEIQEKKGL